jgi:NADH-quinone oxidoreductase subunit C
MSKWFTPVINRFNKLVPGLKKNATRDRGELTIVVPKEQLLDTVKVARDDAELRFESCTSVSGVHYPHDEGHELHVVYSLLSMTHNHRIRLEVAVPEDDPVLDSITSIYPHVDWHERETWDMFGILFQGHPHLTRILMPDDWDGHPLRKDYPLGGVPQKFKGATTPPPEERR